MKLTLDDDELDGQLQRTISAAAYGCADVGEALATGRTVAAGDYGGWYDAWAATADRAAAAAADSAGGGHAVSATQASLRASEYWRQAIYFVRHDLDDERLQHGWREHRRTFRAALEGLPYDTTTAEIPFEGASMTAYLLRPTGIAGDLPVVIAPCGYDSTAEAGFAATGLMALARGYAVLLFEGPGQGGMLYEHRVPMRPDFEVPLGAAIDWLVARPGVDAGRIALIGRSFAGYLAPRGAAHDARVAALICDPGQYDAGARIRERLGEDMWKGLVAKDPEVDAQLQPLLDDPHGAEFYGARMATQGATTVGDWMRLNIGYTLEGHARAITCPTLVTEGEGDFASQSQQLFDALGCPKQFVRFPDAEGAGGHCEGLGQRLFERVAFDWLDETLTHHGN